MCSAGYVRMKCTLPNFVAIVVPVTVAIGEEDHSVTSVIEHFCDIVPSISQNSRSIITSKTESTMDKKASPAPHLLTILIIF